MCVTQWMSDVLCCFHCANSSNRISQNFHKNYTLVYNI